MFNFKRKIEGNWFEIVAWGHRTNMIQLRSDEDGVIWLGDDPEKAVQLLRQAADIIESELTPLIEDYNDKIRKETEGTGK